MFTMGAVVRPIMIHVYVHHWWGVCNVTDARLLVNLRLDVLYERVANVLYGDISTI